MYSHYIPAEGCFSAEESYPYQECGLWGMIAYIRLLTKIDYLIDSHAAIGVEN